MHPSNDLFYSCVFPFFSGQQHIYFLLCSIFLFFIQFSFSDQCGISASTQSWFYFCSYTQSCFFISLFFFFYLFCCGHVRTNFNRWFSHQLLLLAALCTPMTFAASNNIFSRCQRSEFLLVFQIFFSLAVPCSNHFRSAPCSNHFSFCPVQWFLSCCPCSNSVSSHQNYVSLVPTMCGAFPPCAY